MLGTIKCLKIKATNQNIQQALKEKNFTSWIAYSDQSYSPEDAIICYIYSNETCVSTVHNNGRTSHQLHDVLLSVTHSQQQFLCTSSKASQLDYTGRSKNCWYTTHFSLVSGQV